MNRRAAVLRAILLCGFALSACVSSGSGSDFDGDGLKDTVEDRNDNFVVDPGETDFACPDSDADGLCDGLPAQPLSATSAGNACRRECRGCEDCNNNGFWEPCLNETDPLNDDTDNDGIKDGDDPAPLDNLAIDCSQGNVKLPYGASLPPGKGFPTPASAAPTPTVTPSG